MFAIVEENVCNETYDGRYRLLQEQAAIKQQQSPSPVPGLAYQLFIFLS